MNDSETRLIRCSYDKTDQVAELTQIIEEYLPRIEEARGVKEVMIHAHNAAAELAFKAIEFKHKSFEAEREWRLVIGPIDPENREICHRPGELVIIPYVKINFPNGLPLVEIVVGPGPHQERNARSLHQMLKLKGFVNPDVSLSEIPYRPW